MAFAHPMTQPTFAETARQKHQAQPSAGGYWHVRITETVAALELESRRMLQLEAQLGDFAERYYAAVGATMARLEALEEQLEQRSPRAASALPEMLAQCEANQERQTELKVRYRSLAKELHPDTAPVEAHSDVSAQMQALTDAYRRGDLAAMLKLEAQLYLNRLAVAATTNPSALEMALRDVVRATDTYAAGYRQLLNSPLNELMLRAMAAQREGWDWTDAVLKKIERSIEEKEQLLIALVTASGVGLWRAELPA